MSGTPARPALPADCSIGPMRADEVPTLTAWAAAEGWNPGLGDVDVAWAFDPGAFIALRRGDELIGGGTVLSYDGAYGFMGLFIVRADERHRGLGDLLWHHRRDLLRRRLQPGAAIGMDGVFDLVPYYERGGFRLAYRDLRFDGIARGAPDPGVVDGARLEPARVEAFDRRHCVAPRPAFLRGWLAAPGVRSAGLLRDDELVAFAALRPCLVGHRFGPVHAATVDDAARVMGHLMAAVDGEPVQLDVPEPNEAALALASGWSMTESFGCARLYLGPMPQLPVGRIFGVTSFEFG